MPRFVLSKDFSHLHENLELWRATAQALVQFKKARKRATHPLAPASTPAASTRWQSRASLTELHTSPWKRVHADLSRSRKALSMPGLFAGPATSGSRRMSVNEETNFRFDEMLHDAELFALFKDFTRKEHSEEYALFLMEVKEYRLSHPRTKAKALHIFNNYFKDDSRYCIAVGAVKQSEVLLEINSVADDSEPPVDLFDVVYTMVCNTVRTDSFQRFMLTPVYHSVLRRRMMAEQRPPNSCCIVL